MTPAANAPTPATTQPTGPVITLSAPLSKLAAPALATNAAVAFPTIPIIAPIATCNAANPAITCGTNPIINNNGPPIAKTAAVTPSNTDMTVFDVSDNPLNQ